MAKLIQTEHQIQCAYIDWVESMRPKDERFWNIWANANGGLRHIRVAQKLKREGVLSGVLDISVMVPRKADSKINSQLEFDPPYHGAFIEFKAGKNKMTKDQLQFAERMKKQGYYCALYYNTESAIEFTKWWFGIK